MNMCWDRHCLFNGLSRRLPGTGGWECAWGDKASAWLKFQSGVERVASERILCWTIGRGATRDAHSPGSVQRGSGGRFHWTRSLDYQ